MKKKIIMTILIVLCMAAGTACASKKNEQKATGDTSETKTESTEKEEEADRTEFNIASLKGPTTMGLVKLMNDMDSGTARHDYKVTMYGTADEFTAQLIKGEIDVALIPCNLASVLYNKTQGKIQTAAVNTLGVLYMVENGDSVTDVESLRGKTIYAMGKGTTPEYVLHHILEQNGLTVGEDVTVEFKNEATEVAAAMEASTEPVIAMLPQPYVTTLQMQMEGVRVALDMTEEWNKVSPDSNLVTGVVAVQKSFISEHEKAFEEFLEDYKKSTEFVNAQPDTAADYIAQYGIVPKAPIALKALPECNITFLTGKQMKQDIGGYLNVLYDQNPEAVGGKLPDDEFYYMGKEQ